ncbi:MAG: flagellar export chaperone FlgN [Phycisphaerae bacterium]|nr:flagellar export chaperone FlgN [Phycisphaerae bacterium]
MVAQQTKLDSTTLIALLTEQRSLYSQLGELAGTQRGLITGGEPERLLSVLGERQKLVDRLDALGGRLRPYLEGWKAFRTTMTPADTLRVNRLLGEVNTMLTGILEKDKADAQLLAARKSCTAKAIETVTIGRQVGAAYVANAYQTRPSRDWSDE